MLLHENIQGTNFSELINPSTGKSLFKELVAAAKNPNKPLRYLWDKPGNEKEYVYWKETYVSYFQPLDWYICTSIYPEEARLQVKNILTDILFAAAGLMLAALIIAFYLSKSLSLPIKRLSKAARRIETDGLDEVKIPIGGPLETKNLGQLLKTMLTSLSIATKEKEELNNLLECKVEERTAELMQSHKTIEETRNQLVHQERLAEMGILTAGISHEIKNPLGFIKNYAELSQDILKDLKKSIENPDTNESVQDLEHSLLTIVKSSTKANEIVHTMLAHFRGDDTQFKENSINHLLDESQNLVFHGMRVSNPQMPVSIEKNFQTDLPNLYCSSPSLGRVFVNILHNAYDAMSEKWQEAKDSYDPEISLSTDLEDNHILISIKDNGTGIPDHIKQNIFNPFFTTKSEGKGTGLGLSLSYDIIVKDHRGKLLIKTEPNEFTEFQIFIPLNIKDLQGGSD